MTAGSQPTRGPRSENRATTRWYMRYWVWVVIGVLLIGGIVVGTISNPLPLPAPPTTPASPSSGP